jgi:hypothetical protein
MIAVRVLPEDTRKGMRASRTVSRERVLENVKE